MAKKIRFPLKMKNGTEVRTLEELRENFDIESVLGYFADGKLQTWLADRYYDVEAAKVAELDPDSDNFKAKLCEVLGVPYIENPNEEIDLDYINRRNEKKAVLSQLTDDTELLNNIDSVALNQDDLLDCYDMGLSTIYLVGDTLFSIPVSVTNVTYIGRLGAKAEIRSAGDIDFKEKNISFEGISFIGDIKPVTSNNSDVVSSNRIVDRNNVPECDGTNFKELLELAKGGNVSAQFEIGKFLYEQEEHKLGEKWLIKSIEGNCAKAMYYCALFRENQNLNGKKGVNYMLTAAKNGYVPAQYLISQIYGRLAYVYRQKENRTLEYKWLNKAAENGHIIAQKWLGKYLYDGHFGVKKIDEAVMWLTKVAECGDIEAQRTLGHIFFDQKNKEKAIEWLTKASENGDEISDKYLEQIKQGRTCLTGAGTFTRFR